MAKIILRGNTLLHISQHEKTGRIPVISLECKHRHDCSVCRACYASGGRFRFQTVKNAIKNNNQLAGSDWFTSLSSIPHPYIRMFGVGDFDSAKEPIGLAESVAAAAKYRGANFHLPTKSYLNAELWTKIRAVVGHLCQYAYPEINFEETTPGLRHIWWDNYFISRRGNVVLDPATKTFNQLKQEILVSFDQYKKKSRKYRMTPPSVIFCPHDAKKVKTCEECLLCYTKANTIVVYKLKLSR